MILTRADFQKNSGDASTDAAKHARRGSADVHVCRSLSEVVEPAHYKTRVLIFVSPLQSTKRAQLEHQIQTELKIISGAEQMKKVMHFLIMRSP